MMIVIVRALKSFKKPAVHLKKRKATQKSVKGYKSCKNDLRHLYLVAKMRPRQTIQSVTDSHCFRVSTTQGTTLMTPLGRE